jgi:hypothetical protein
LSDFTAHGYVTCKDGEILCWFLKIYKSKSKSGQIAGYHNLLYKSEKIERNGNILGKYYYVDYENNSR